MQKLGFFKRNGLSIACFGLFLFTLIGHIWAGWAKFNQEQEDDHKPAVSVAQYVVSGDFMESLFENWESEFLQMGLYVILTAMLFQAGSPESKDPDAKEEVDREPDPKKKDAPWAVRKGGLILRLYKHSLSVSLFILFVLSFVAHAVGGARAFNHKAMDEGKPTKSLVEFAGSSELWYQSFQNWQSEFLSIGMIIVLSIYLREKGSSQSKPVDAPHSETGS